MTKLGRKSKYETVILPRINDIQEWLKNGISQKEIAKRLGIGYTTWRDHKRNIPYLSTVVEETRKDAIENVEKSMYQQALGFTKQVQRAMKLKEVIYENGKRLKEIEKVEYYNEEVYIPPSVNAGQFLLKNWKKEHYSNNPAELEAKKEEIKYRRKNEF